MLLDGIHLGRYLLLRVLGSGGMGEVYLANDTRINRQVAVKVLRNEVSSYPDTTSIQRAAQLFEREMKTISRLDHPRILPLFDYGEQDVNGTTLTYMVMPYRPEGSLDLWLRQRTNTGLLSVQEVVHLITQAASALQHAHDNGIIHQDIKPSNFLVRIKQEQPSRPDLLLADFGVAKFTAATSSTSQTIRGTPMYMAPEQWEGHPVLATDQYALAIMTYELLVGRLPFEGGPGPIMFKHLTVQPEPPSRLNPRLPESVDAVLLRALAKRPEQRFASISEFAWALQQAVQIGDSTTLSISRSDESTFISPANLPTALHSLPLTQARTLPATNFSTIPIQLSEPIPSSSSASTPVSPTKSTSPGRQTPVLVSKDVTESPEYSPPSASPLAAQGANGAHIPATSAYADGAPAYRRRPPSGVRAALLVLLAILLIIGGGAIYVSAAASQRSAANDLRATMTAQANITANAQNAATQTAAAQAINAANATGTAQATINAAGTARAATTQASQPGLSVNKTTLYESRQQIDCNHISTIDLTGHSGASCSLTLTNNGDSSLNWSATTDAPNGAGYIADQNGNPANAGSIPARQAQAVEIVIVFLPGVSCPTTFHFTIHGPANSVTVTWICDVSPAPTSTPTPSPTSTPSPTPTPSPTSTPSPTPSPASAPSPTSTLHP